MQVDQIVHRARRLSLTSLIDVIFLLLMFFMLSSTFTRFSELEIESGSGGGAASTDKPQIIIRLGEGNWSVNGLTMKEDAGLAELLRLEAQGAKTAILFVEPETTSQALLTALDAIRHQTRISARLAR